MVKLDNNCGVDLTAQLGRKDNFLGLVVEISSFAPLL